MPQNIHRALLLAAGRGNRLMPLTEHLPKPMVAIGGFPVLEWLLHGLRYTGINEAIIIHGYLGEVIEQYFGDGKELGMRLYYRKQEKLNGTASAMLQAEELCGSGPILLQWGDILVDPVNYPAIFEKFQGVPHPPDCVLGMNWVEDPYAGGAVYRDGDRVIRVAEKLPQGTAGTHWNIGGLIVFQPTIWRYLHQLIIRETGDTYITEAIDLLIRDNGRVSAHEIIGERMHFTTPEDVARLNHDPRLKQWKKSFFPF